MAEHRLKTWDRYWLAVNARRKRFEIRLNDRGFQTGDTLVLLRVENEHPHGPLDIDGRHPSMMGARQAELHATVTYICHGGQWGLADNWICMSICLVDRDSHKGDGT